MNNLKNFKIKKARNGRGLFIVENFSENEKLFEVKGKLITCDEDDEIEEEVRNNAYRFNKDFYLSPEGELGNFVNHSCLPNACVLKKKEKLYIVSIKNIKKNEEILIDYSTIIGDDDSWVMDCFCKEEVCRKKIGRFSKLSKKIKDKYLSLNMVPNYIYEK